MPKSNVTGCYSVEQVRAAIWHYKAALGGISWLKLGKAIGINGSLLNAVARGERKPGRRMLRALGFVRLQDMSEKEIRAAFESRKEMTPCAEE